MEVATKVVCNSFLKKTIMKLDKIVKTISGSGPKANNILRYIYLLKKKISEFQV